MAPVAGTWPYLTMVTPTICTTVIYIILMMAMLMSTA
jgi:hypothetical protein